jgi:hypothetical protein
MWEAVEETQQPRAKMDEGRPLVPEISGEGEGRERDRDLRRRGADLLKYY